MIKPNHKPTSLALSTALASGLVLTGSAFAMQPMAQGYLQAATATAASKTVEEGKCGAGMKAGEGKCGMDQADIDKDGKISRTEFTTAHPDKPAGFDEIDSNQDGSLDSAEIAAHHAAKEKASTEGKCGEGKCGEGKCGGNP